MNRIYYDIECFADYVLVSCKHEGGWTDFEYATAGQDETLATAGLKTFFETYKKNHLFIGYNNLGYDNQILCSLLNDPQPTIAKLMALNHKIITLKEETYPEDLGLYCFDLSYCFPVPRTTKPGEPYKRGFKALKSAGITLGFGNILYCPVPFDQEQTSAEERETIKEYCHNDVLLCEQIFNSEGIKTRFEGLKNIARTYKIPIRKIFRLSNPAIAELAIKAIMGAETYAKKQPEPLTFAVNDVIDPKVKFSHEGLREAEGVMRHWNRDIGTLHMNLTIGNGVAKIGVGGLHYNTAYAFTFRKGEGKRLIDIDVDSYYPTIIANLEIGPRGIEKEYSSIYKKLIVLKRDAKNPVEREMYKLIINSATGKLKSPYSLFYSPRANETMTLNGQLILLELIEALHLNKFVIVNANTDGLTISVEDTEERMSQFNDIVRAWETKWGFATKQNEYELFIQRDVNSYYAKKTNGEEKFKGVFNPNNKSEFPCVAKAAVHLTLHPNDDVKEFLRSLPPKDFSKTIERKTWALEGDQVPFNKQGANRFYVANNIQNRLYSVVTSNGKERKILVAKNIRTANGGTPIDKAHLSI